MPLKFYHEPEIWHKWRNTWCGRMRSGIHTPMICNLKNECWIIEGIPFNYKPTVALNVCPWRAEWYPFYIQISEFYMHPATKSMPRFPLDLPNNPPEQVPPLARRAWCSKAALATWPGKWGDELPGQDMSGLFDHFLPELNELAKAECFVIFFRPLRGNSFME